ncbi:type I-E CRISPR-associated protein Cas7/Cse4/CasC [Lacticaseibacillus pabuli]|uniref:Type I-E CRISPR-associated protein Cas7/Cse4/CasC n=1 Tax=Lacticaseibacillus pabuli TaxID=3025672 RepID=A0ABY7WU06_9LACO|nr:type I-E CRISPR-associated protein Cas7/Cse4/CasC [Lacticaseibacillus sp. KACC 23028]WDF83246.1 type I-E CRISPR-associated protein Cas7/Cse4/CasC [Lacticaseibacillus sp. KACC 23028]
MTENNLYMDINVLQTVPSSNINRDDTGAPKTALYGGVTRARVSSQSWKHAMRREFNADKSVNEGVRSKDVANLLAKEIQAQDNSLDEDAAKTKAEEVFSAAGIKLDKKTNQTGALLLVSRGQVQKLAKYALSHDELDKKEVKAVLKGDQSVDLALFGRMVADNPELNVDASAQVAHAISTHEIVPEFDYFTAMDDLQPEDNAGAAMLGTVEYNSSTLYRYANLNMRELMHNLGDGDAVQAAMSFVKSFLLSMPTGKQNTFANKTLPSYVMITLRDDTPVNLVSAFEKPVESKTGYVAPSIKALENEYEQTLKFVDEPLNTVVLSTEKSDAGVEASDLQDLYAKVSDSLTKVAQNEDTTN